MKKIFFIGAMVSLIGMMSACDPTCTCPSNEELIVGQWSVVSHRHVTHDLFTGHYEDVTMTPADSSYVGYDEAEFFVDGTMRWHMNDRYFHNGMFDSPYREFKWLINGDSLHIFPDRLDNAWWNFEIKQINSTALVVEDHHFINDPPLYGHHTMEITESYDFKRK